MIKEKNKLSPIMTFIVLTFIVIVLSGFLHFINVQSEYNTVNVVSNELVKNVVEVNNLFSISGIKHIVSTTVNAFVNFEPLAMLIIVLIGIGILEKSGFLETFFGILTKNTKKNTVTFILVLICLLFSIVGNIGYVIMLPLGALLFKYARRNPLGGIITTFASLSFGYGINVLLSSNQSNLLTLTLNAAKTIDVKYSIGSFYSLFIMIVSLIVVAFAFTNVTEKKIMPKLNRYEHTENESVITKNDLKGFIISLGVGLLYLLLVIYMIIPGLPLSGGLLDKTEIRYIDMLFGSNSLFSQGFVFIVTFWFVIIGLVYGFITKRFKSNNDVAEGLAHSLDGIGGTLILIFFASLFINVYNESNIGTIIVAGISNLISLLNFNGILLIVMSIVLIAISNLFMPSSLIKWNIISSGMIPLYINSSISPEFATVIYSLSECATSALTPLLIYSVLYVSFMQKYNTSEKTLTLFGCHKYMISYAFIYIIIIFIILVGWYILGLPIGISAFPGVSYGA